MEPTVTRPFSLWLSIRARRALSKFSLWVNPEHYYIESLRDESLMEAYPQTGLEWGHQFRSVFPRGEIGTVRYRIHGFLYRRILKPIIYWLCKVMIGHEISRTEKGYGGGPYEDRHCRWCDKVFQVPLGEFALKHGKELLTKESCRFQ